MSVLGHIMLRRTSSVKKNIPVDDNRNYVKASCFNNTTIHSPLGRYHFEYVTNATRASLYTSGTKWQCSLY